MDKLTPLEWGIILGLIGLVLLALSRATKPPRRDDDTYGAPPPKQSKTSRHLTSFASRLAMMSLPEDVQNEVDTYIRNGQTISAIKLVRENLKIDLRGAKELVEARIDELGK